MSPDELADILSMHGSRQAPYWPQGDPPEGWHPGWKTKDGYEARLAEQRRTGRADPRVASWIAYDREVRECWNRRMKLCEHLAAGREA